MNSPSYRGVFRWRPACWCRVSGADAASFLQGQFTNDLKPLVPGVGIYGLWLNVKGKVLADSFVFRGAEQNEFFIGSYHSTTETIRQRLEAFIIADDVVIEDQTAEWAGLTVFGPTATEDITVAAQALPDSASRTWRVVGRRTTEPHAEWFVPVANEPAAFRALGERTSLSAPEVEHFRIEAGLPAIPRDIGAGDLPNEGALEAAAISYTKGCYLGQEVMARLKSMGQVRRKLLRVAGSGPLPPTPAPLFVGERQVGELRSVSAQGSNGWIGLAIVSLLHVPSGTRMSQAAHATPTIDLRDNP